MAVHYKTSGRLLINKASGLLLINKASGWPLIYEFSSVGALSLVYGWFSLYHVVGRPGSRVESLYSGWLFINDASGESSFSQFV